LIKFATQCNAHKGGPGAAFAFDIPVEIISPVTAVPTSSAGNLISEIEVQAVSLAPNPVTGC